jgi:hypothetical protein
MGMFTKSFGAASSYIVGSQTWYHELRPASLVQDTNSVGTTKSNALFCPLSPHTRVQSIRSSPRTGSPPIYTHGRLRGYFHVSFALPSTCAICARVLIHSTSLPTTTRTRPLSHSSRTLTRKESGRPPDGEAYAPSSNAYTLIDSPLPAILRPSSSLLNCLATSERHLFPTGYRGYWMDSMSISV